MRKPWPSQLQWTVLDDAHTTGHRTWLTLYNLWLNGEQDRAINAGVIFG